MTGKTELTSLPAWRLAERIRDGEVSAEALCAAYLDNIGEHDDTLGAYVRVTGDQALEQARAVDRSRAAGGRLGALAGLPIAVKDNICRRGAPTTCASKILEGYRPPYDATAVGRLLEAGAVILGKTNMDEFAMGSSNEYSSLRPVRNPWDLERAPGGSSGGSAAAVAAGMAAAALGSDTAGSVRQPAAFCGVVGLKPTYGRVSRYGLVAFGSSLDVIGPLTRCVRDAALLLRVMAGRDPNDSTSHTEAPDDYEAALAAGAEGRRVGVPREVFQEGLDGQVRTAFERALERLREAGAEIREIDLPTMSYGVPAYYIVACAEAASNLARYDGIRYGLREPGFCDLRDQYRRTRTAGFGPEVRRRIMLGTFVLSSGYYDAYYRKGTQVRAKIRAELDTTFEGVDLIATPTAPTPAFRLGEKLDDPVQMYLSDIFTVTANMAGVPSLSLNCGFSAEGLPIGFQLVAPHLREGRLLAAAQALEQALDLPPGGPELKEAQRE